MNTVNERFTWLTMTAPNMPSMVAAALATYLPRAAMSVLVQDEANIAWNRSEITTETMENKHYLIRVDGRGRVLLRTRAHLEPPSIQQHADNLTDSQTGDPGSPAYWFTSISVGVFLSTPCCSKAVE